MTAKKIKKYYEEKLPQIIESLKKGYRPEKIILFGSMLHSKSFSNDIDLFIVKDTVERRRGKRATEAWSYLPFKSVPVDFLVYTPSEIKQEIKRGNVFITEILQQGKILYEEKVS